MQTKNSVNHTPREINEDKLMKIYKHHASEPLKKMNNSLRSVGNVFEDGLNSMNSGVAGLHLASHDPLTSVQLDESINSVESTFSPRSTGNSTDRATSPSAASVTSVQSVSSQVSISGRR